MVWKNFFILSGVHHGSAGLFLTRLLWHYMYLASTSYVQINWFWLQVISQTFTWHNSYSEIHSGSSFLRKFWNQVRWGKSEVGGSFWLHRFSAACLLWLLSHMETSMTIPRSDIRVWWPHVVMHIWRCRQWFQDLQVRKQMLKMLEEGCDSSVQMEELVLALSHCLFQSAADLGLTGACHVSCSYVLNWYYMLSVGRKES